MKTYNLPNKDIKITGDELDHLIKQREQESGVWKPEDNGEYYYVNDTLCVVANSWHNLQPDITRYKSGNVFKTEEEAEAYAEYLKAKAEVAHAIREANGGWTPDWDDCDRKVFFLYFNYEKRTWSLSWNRVREKSFLPYAKNREILKNIRDEQAGELETIANYRKHHNV